jgi:hypothetical protein
MVFKVVISREEHCYLTDILSLQHCFGGGDTIEPLKILI